MSNKKFYPVIHCVTPFAGGIGHALVNTRVAMNNGADGVFLIGHNLHFDSLCEIYEQVRKQFPRIWIGINFLDISSKKNWQGLQIIVKSKCYDLNALWIDQMPNVKLELPQRPQPVQVFGGVAFKYIAANLKGNNLDLACKEAMKVVDVITTSGNKTGELPSAKKLSEIRCYIDDESLLAVASGVDEYNVSTILKTTDIILASTNISEVDFYRNNYEYLLPEKVQRLGKIIHQFNT